MPPDKQIDLTPYTARGFAGNIDSALASISVGEPNRSQTKNMVRLCAETEPVLYGPDFSSTRVQYRPGARPQLERTAAEFHGPLLQRVEGAMHWTIEHVRHPHVTGPLPGDRGLTEEQLIDSRRGWCNEQSRVFIALCQTMNIPGRLCFLFHMNTKAGHTTTEVYLDGRWVWVDVTFALIVALPDGRLAGARDLSGPYRDLAHAAYRPVLERHYQHICPFVEDMPGWNSRERPDPRRGGDLLHEIGIANYVIKGVDIV